MFFELLNAPVSAVLIDLERICPNTGNCTWHVMILTSDVYMVGVFQPIKQVLIAHLPQELYLHVDHCRLADLRLLHVFDFLWLLLDKLVLWLLLLFIEDWLLLLRFEELLLDVFDFLGRVHYSFTNNTIA